MINNSKARKQYHNKMTDKTIQVIKPNLLINHTGQNSVDVKNLINDDILNRQQLNQMEQEVLCPDQQGQHDNSPLSKRDWTDEEDMLVYTLHNQYGNKWAIIAERLKGRYLVFYPRTDNCIKNHFYSRLRKGLRKVNKLIEDYHKQEFREFKIIDLYKVIEASDQKFKQINSYPNEMTDSGHDLKNRIFIFAEEDSDGTQQFTIKAEKLLRDLNEFTKNYRRKSKKCRRYSPMGVGSVYRNNSKKQCQTSGNMEQQFQKIEKQNNEKEKEKVRIQSDVRKEEEAEPRQRKMRVKKQSQRNSQVSKQTALTSGKKQVPKQAHNASEQSIMVLTKSRNTYRQFSDDEGEEKDDAQYHKEQRLNHFAENILKTFKSYYSFKSFKSNSAMEEPFFQ